MSEFRNILVHNYLGNIDPLTIQSVISTQLTPLENVVEEILTKHEGFRDRRLRLRQQDLEGRLSQNTRVDARAA